MKRRDLLKSALAGAALHASKPSLAGSQETVSATMNNTASSLHSVLDMGPSLLKTQGQWPKDISGSLYRNGPVLHERNGFRHNHMFDGDGMIQKFDIANGKVQHQAKMVRSQKFIDEENAGRYLYPGLKSTPPKPYPSGNNDSANPANTAIRKIGDKFFALWEAGSAYEIDPDSLNTEGRHDWGPDYKHLPFSAHPLQDSNGDWWNIGSWIYSGKAMVVLYQLSSNAKLKRIKVLELAQRGYMHAFCMTQNYIVLVNTAHLYNKGKNYFDSFDFDHKGVSQIVLIDKNSLSIKRTVEVPANFVFHFGNAYEQGNELFFSMSQYDDASIMHNGLAAGKTSTFTSDTIYRSNLTSYRINLNNGSVQQHQSNVDLEFPAYHLESPFKPQKLAGCGRQHKDSPESLLLINPVSHECESFNFGDQTIIEEPLFIKDKMGKDYLLHSFIDKQKQQSGLALFKANSIQHGPIATANLEKALPIGFHGCFVPS